MDHNPAIDSLVKYLEDNVPTASKKAINAARGCAIIFAIENYVAWRIECFKVNDTAACHRISLKEVAENPMKEFEACISYKNEDAFLTLWNGRKRNILQLRSLVKVSGSKEVIGNFKSLLEEMKNKFVEENSQYSIHVSMPTSKIWQVTVSAADGGLISKIEERFSSFLRMFEDLKAYVKLHDSESILPHPPRKGTIFQDHKDKAFLSHRRGEIRDFCTQVVNNYFLVPCVQDFFRLKTALNTSVGEGKKAADEKEEPYHVNRNGALEGLALLSAAESARFLILVPSHFVFTSTTLFGFLFARLREYSWRKSISITIVLLVVMYGLRNFWDSLPVTNSLKRKVIIVRTTVLSLLTYKMSRRRLRSLQAHAHDDNERERLSSALWNKVNSAQAIYIRVMFAKLGGFWLKAAQYMSARADVMPKEFVSELSKLQDFAPWRPFEPDVRNCISAGLASSIDNTFKEINAKPLASASIAQVHRATTCDGRDVVLKIQHRNVQGCMKLDMAMLRLICRVVAWFEPEYDFRPVILEWLKESKKELDFVREGSNVNAVSNFLARPDIMGNRVYVPKCIPELSSKTLLVLDFADNCVQVGNVAALKSYGVQRTKLLRTITEALAFQIFHLGIFNGDPREYFCI